MSCNPFVTAPDAGEAVWHGDALWTFTASSADTDGAFWLAEISAGKTWASPVHLHTREDETFVVLEGQLWVRVADTESVIPEGGTVFLPRGIPHAYRVESDAARFLALGTPGGFDGWIHQTGRPALTRTLPPPATEEPDWPAYVAALQDYGVQFIAPPS